MAGNRVGWAPPSAQNVREKTTNSLKTWVSRAILLLMVYMLSDVPSSFAGAEREKGDYFSIRVVDDESGRGVPLVELRTTNELRFYSDSNGIVAINEPGLMDQEVYFHITGHGYEFPKDGFGYRGKRMKLTRDGSAEVKIKRLNVAERLYRVTGEGIYRDSVLVGQPVPLDHPVLNGLVTGQDSVLATPYRGKLFWIWGDTNRPSYPLGNFGVSGATSEWPSRKGESGGLDPSVGVNLKYFVDESGFSRPMVSSTAIPGPGPKWLGGLVTIRDEKGTEQLIAKYMRMKNLGETLERGLVIFNDSAETFERLVQFDLDAPLHLDGHPFRATVAGDEYFYFGYSPPFAIRVRADLKHVTDPASYEGFSCLVAGTRYDKATTKLDRGPDGQLRYAWKANTAPIGFDQQNELITAGKMKREESWLQIEDVETGERVKMHAGSVYWNDYRKRWVMIAEQAGGTSNLGEVWFAEADTPLGPWAYARKIVTHEKYSFYNPTQHPFFDQEGGRLIYFQGTYSELFSGTPERTPRYDYNQIMYRLALDDPRLSLPAPVYRMKGDGGTVRYLMGNDVESLHGWSEIEESAFFAVPSDQRHEGLIPIYGNKENQGVSLVRKPSAGKGEAAQPLFYALPIRPVTNGDSTEQQAAASPSIVPLYEYRHRDSGPPLYSTATALSEPTLRRSEEPICRVWRSPMSQFILDRQARPVPFAKE